MIVTGTNRGIFAVDAATASCSGRTTGRRATRPTAPRPPTADGYVFWANGYGKGGICLKLSKEGGKVAADVAWTTHDMVCHHGGYVIHEGYIYGNHGGGWTCLDLKTGKKKWQSGRWARARSALPTGCCICSARTRARPGWPPARPRACNSKGKVKVKGRRPELGASGGRRRAALPPLRHAPCIAST